MLHTIDPQELFALEYRQAKWLDFVWVPRELASFGIRKQKRNERDAIANPSGINRSHTCHPRRSGANLLVGRTGPQIEC